MTFDEYQVAALRTASPADKHNELFHLLLGLVGETGEVAEKFKKLVRDHDSDLSKLDRADMTKELGDILWYVAVLANHLGIKLEDVVQTNVAKLASRQARGTLMGSGDNR
jgi:NTP pyrophosphatase (non-canonical NTP hydrolase)